MTLHFVRWPMDFKADAGDQHLTCPHCVDDWESFDAPKRAIIGRAGPQRRCSTCGSWVDWPEAANAV